MAGQVSIAYCCGEDKSYARDVKRALFALVLWALGCASALFAAAPDFTTLLADNPKLNRWLTVQMTIGGGGPEKSYTAALFADSAVLWENGNQALYWATAFPPTEATREELGVLIAARRGASGQWHVMKSVRLQAIGKNADAKAELTSGGIPVEDEGPVVIVTLEQGGRGYGYTEAFTYSMQDDDLILHRPR
jgi:hypothetical protein